MSGRVTHIESTIDGAPRQASFERLHPRPRRMAPHIAKEPPKRVKQRYLGCLVAGCWIGEHPATSRPITAGHGAPRTADIGAKRSLGCHGTRPAATTPGIDEQGNQRGHIGEHFGELGRDIDALCLEPHRGGEPEKQRESSDADR